MTTAAPPSLVVERCAGCQRPFVTFPSPSDAVVIASGGKYLGRELCAECHPRYRCVSAVFSTQQATRTFVMSYRYGAVSRLVLTVEKTPAAQAALAQHLRALADLVEKGDRNA